jgi:2,5-diketo-D-gluconate reductase A
MPDYTLNDGSRIPAIGFGTFPMTGKQAADATMSAIEVGYRLLDTALLYGNEAEVGEAIARSGSRSELTVTTKTSVERFGVDDTVADFERSAAALGGVDLLLIHWPGESGDAYRDTWRALVELRDRGAVRSIGVCNFSPDHLERIVDDTGVAPAVNQIRLNPYEPQHEWRRAHAELSILTECYTPLALNPFHATHLLEEPVVVGVAAAHDVTPAQAVLRWHVELGLIPIPKSANAARQRENLDVFGFELTPDELDAFATLDGAVGPTGRSALE